MPKNFTQLPKAFQNLQRQLDDYLKQRNAGKLSHEDLQEAVKADIT